MIRQADDMSREIREHMRGGEGQVVITHLLQPGQFQGQARLCARLTLDPGCSIGLHEHVREEEIFYCLEGEGLLSESPEQSERLIRRGDSAICPAGASHTIRNAGDRPLELLALILTIP